MTTFREAMDALYIMSGHPVSAVIVIQAFFGFSGFRAFWITFATDHACKKSK